MATFMWWEHNDATCQWELGYVDDVDRMIYETPRRIIVGSIGDEMLARHSRVQIEPYVRARFRVPLPTEAYAQ